MLGVQQAAAAGRRVLPAGRRAAVPGGPQPAAGEEFRRKRGEEGRYNFKIKHTNADVPVYWFSFIVYLWRVFCSYRVVFLTVDKENKVTKIISMSSKIVGQQQHSVAL